MAEKTANVVSAETTATRLLNGVVGLDALTGEFQSGCRVFVHYNGPTDQLNGMCTGMAVLDPGVSPHPPHRHGSVGGSRLNLVKSQAPSSKSQWTPNSQIPSSTPNANSQVQLPT
jgi:hypothetical protein